LNKAFYIFPLLLALLLSSCGVKKYLPADKYLLKAATLKIVAADSVNTRSVQRDGLAALNERATPRWRVWWHYRDGFLLRWLGKKIGRDPIFYDDRQRQNTLQLLENRAVNTGHFYNRASSQTDTSVQQQAISVDYILAVGPTYTIDTVQYVIRDTVMAYLVDSLASSTVLKPGDAYELGALKAERRRLEAAFRKAAYYYFSAEDLEFLADTTGNGKAVLLFLKLKDDVPIRHTKPQYLRNIRVLSNFQGKREKGLQQDSTTYEGMQIVCHDCPLRDEILAGAIGFRPGSPYTPSGHEKTVERLAGFNTFRYISTNYQPVPGTDSLLDMTIYLTPDLKHSLSQEVGVAYNSSNYVGPELGLSYSNRNLLGGAELFTFDGDFTYNFFLGSVNGSDIPQSGIFGANAGLAIPRFWLPTRKKILPNLLQAQTSIKLGGKVETLSLQLDRFTATITNSGFSTLLERLTNDPGAREGVKLWQFSTDYGYSWKRRPTLFNSFTLLRLRYQNPQVSTEELLSLSRSLSLTAGTNGLGRLDRMFLIGPQFTWLLDTRLSKARPADRRSRQHHFFTNLNTGLSFNTILPIGQNQRQLSSERSRYLQPELDFRYYWLANSELTFAARIHTGAALPFTERAIVPYFDLYTVGGPNSLRGFIPRGLGPGVTVPFNNNLLGQNGYGNVLFESSLELRYRLTSLFEVAFFGDAGNVWLYKTETTPTTGDFKLNRFTNELAVNAGLGLRIDLSFLLIRIDLAKPVRIPYETTPDTPPDDKIKLVLGFGQAF
jgi:hypothetical protein